MQEQNGHCSHPDHWGKWFWGGQCLPYGRCLLEPVGWVSNLRFSAKELRKLQLNDYCAFSLVSKVVECYTYTANTMGSMWDDYGIHWEEIDED
jgi:hypothetical protein